MVCLDCQHSAAGGSEEERVFVIPEGCTDLVATLASLEVNLRLHHCQHAAVVEAVGVKTRVARGGLRRAVWACFGAWRCRRRC